MRAASHGGRKHDICIATLQKNKRKSGVRSRPASNTLYKSLVEPDVETGEQTARAAAGELEAEAMTFKLRAPSMIDIMKALATLLLRC